MNKITEFIKRSPKTELHLHIEGTLEPSLLFRLAKENNIQIPFSSINEMDVWSFCAAISGDFCSE